VRFNAKLDRETRRRAKSMSNRAIGRRVKGLRRSTYISLR